MTKTSKELTNDWKDKKLYDGLYYIRLKNGKTPIAELETWCRYDDEVEEPYKTSQEFFEYPKDIISEVLSPIPSYDEYKAMQDHISYLEKCISIYEQKEKLHTNDSIEYNNIVEENNDLRERLKECDGCVRCLRAFGVSDCNGNNVNDLITKIEEVLK